MHLRRIAALALAALLPVAMEPAAHGASSDEIEWRRSLHYEVVGGVVPPGKRSVVVVGAGLDARRARAVASVLAEELGKARTDVEVLPSSPLGATDGVSDSDLVTRAAILPPETGAADGHARDDSDDDDGPGLRRTWLVDTVVVVRLYQTAGPVSDGAPGVETAVISTYDRGGERLLSLSVERGKPIPAEDRLLLRTTATQTARDLALLQELAARQIRFEHPRADNVGDAKPTIGGRDGRLGGDEFYRALGRMDLARTYSARQAMRITLMLDGPALTISSVVTITTAAALRLTVCTQRSPGGACLMTGPAIKETAGVIVGAVLANLGVSMFFVGLFYDPHPIGMEEATRLVSRFNDEERRALGLPPDRREVVPIRPRTSLLLVPDVGPTGGGLSLVGTF